MQTPDAAGPQYKLVGVVEHRGSQLGSGHYVAYVQRGLQPSQSCGLPPSPQTQTQSTEGAEALEAVPAPEPKAAGAASEQPAHNRAESHQSLSEEVHWTYVSDTTVEATSSERVLACEAYILLYMRVS